MIYHESEKNGPNKKLHDQTCFIMVANCYADCNVNPSSLLEKVQTTWWHSMSWDWMNNQGPWFTMISEKNDQIRNSIIEFVSSLLRIVMPIVMLIHQVCWKNSKLPYDTLWAEIERIIKVHDLPWIEKNGPNKKLCNQTCFIMVAHCYAYCNVNPSSLLEKV